MRKTPLIIASWFAAAPLLAAPGGFGGLRGPGPEHHGEPGARFERHALEVADLLQLDDAQRAAFDQMRTTGRAAAGPRLAEMRSLQDELRALLDGGSTDTTAIGEKMLAIHKLRNELRAERRAAEAEFVALLNDEQRFAFQVFKESREQRRAMRGRHRGSGFGSGDAPEPELD